MQQKEQREIGSWDDGTAGLNPVCLFNSQVLLVTDRRERELSVLP